MATEQAKPPTDEVKMDLFEDDDEFEEFEIDQGSAARNATVEFLKYLFVISRSAGVLVCGRAFGIPNASSYHFEYSCLLM
ncbi:hypothetical protein C2S51_018583 [Perilla frutescens var. frutescens]|nr:hypothetical protein C2S51_018583 [Perilla frutescens var. frutescens]